MIKLIVLHSGHPLRTELAESFVAAANFHGIVSESTSTLDTRVIQPNEIVIVIGGTPIPQLLNSNSTIHWRFDQLTSNLFKNMQSGQCYIWECNKQTYAARLRQTSQVSYMPFPILAPSDFPNKTDENCPIDLLLLGGGTPRRWEVIKLLRNLGLAASLCSNTWGAAKLHTLTKSKVVLNIHQFETGFNEIWRFYEGLKAGCPVISEPSMDTSADTAIAGSSILFVKETSDVQTLANDINECFQKLRSTSRQSIAIHALSVCQELHTEFGNSFLAEMKRLSSNK